ncbi:AABR07020786.1 [Phodopus roborovskii]|uniref:AABR07020786.1 protein n=1 Tax=Phodopus roborovskii TaxID=109678 RepID=A0AAV0A3M3_PHORO|nr:AABR07020786.1 [Phodopus roborovskii]
MAVIPWPPASELTLPRGHFTLGDRHLASDRMSQTPRRSRNWRKRRAGGDGERQQRQADSPFCRIPFRLPQILGLPNVPTRPSGKLVERRAAGCQHLIAPERWLATPEEPGFHSTAVRHPCTRTAAGPRGLPARSSSSSSSSSQALHSSISRATVKRAGETAPHALPTPVAQAAGLCWLPPTTPALRPPYPPPRGLRIKPGEAECEPVQKPSVAPERPLGMLQSPPGAPLGVCNTCLHWRRLSCMVTHGCAPDDLRQ